jgi:benzoyl-CoA 2,3-dioxygenase component B
MSSVDHQSRIPNNVGLAGDRKLQRALEQWQPRFLQWWQEHGPADYQQADVYLRTATSVDQEGWAHFDYVKMPDYRWGIFLAEANPDRTIGYGEHLGEPAWQQVPGEYRAELQRLIVVQGDTEPASVEQQRHLCATAPSQYDLRNLFQVNVEEARHLWAMVYLLHAHFGRDGRAEADELLHRTPGDADHPRILGAFNERTPDWLSFFFFTYFPDRDGKYQLGSLAESGFDPLARTCQFMLKEEAHHMFVGATGVGRVVQRTVELMREHDTDDIAPHGGVNLDTLQRYLNFHFSVSLDLFGAETSTNAANYYAAGLKGRFAEANRHDDHRLHDETVDIPTVRDGRIDVESAPALTALNTTLRDDYAADCQKGIDRWNRVLAPVGAELRVPHVGFNRHVGRFRDHHVTPGGELVDAATWEAQRSTWLPTPDEEAHVASLMVPVRESGRMAGWLSAPANGINGQPTDVEYVRP